MKMKVRNLVPSLLMATSQTNQYTSSNCVASIDKATSTNNTTSNHVVSVWIVASGDTPSDDNLIVNAQTIFSSDTYLYPELVGKIMPDGASIYTISSSATALNFDVSGREIY